MLDTVIFIVGLGVWSALITYALVFRIFPTFFPAKSHEAPVVTYVPKKPPRASYSTLEGFRSFAKNHDLTVDDIVKGLSREGKKD